MTDNSNGTNSDAQHSRRRFLQAVAAGTVAGGVGIGAAAAQDDADFVLGGDISSWTGRVPSEIEGETNPTLQMEAGETYTLRWENVDGQPHNFAFLDGSGEPLPVIQTDGDPIALTEITAESGATQTFEFVADPAIEEYFCEVHPTSMRGAVDIQGGGTQTAGEETAEEPERYVPEGPSIGLQQVASGPLRQPTDFAVAGGDRWFVLDQNGQIYAGDDDGLQSEPFLDIQDRLYYLTGTSGGYERSEGFDERGLLGVAFHPDFQNNGRFYVRYSAPPRDDGFVGPDRENVPDNYDHTFVVAEFQANDDLSSADPESERIILEIPEPQFNHNAGDIEFGPDGYLYIPTGDGGGANDTYVGHVDDWYDDNEGGNGQDVSQNLLGAMLRIDVDSRDGDLPYGIPDDNPLAGTDAPFPEHYAWGLRNPWGISFNDGQLFAADVGQALYEEVNVIEKGGNYGWNVKEGTHCFSPESQTEPPEQCPSSTPDDVRGGEPLIDPVIEYPHTYQNQPVGISVTGGFVALNDTVPEIQNRYVFGDWSQSFSEPRGRLFVASRAREEGELWPMSELMVEGGEDSQLNRFVLAFGRGPNGDIYVLTSTSHTLQGNGEVYRIVPPGEGDQISAPSPETTTAAPGEETTVSPGEGNATTPTGDETSLPDGETTQSD